jgi:hypothetical protein
MTNAAAFIDTIKASEFDRVEATPTASIRR